MGKSIEEQRQRIRDNNKAEALRIKQEYINDYRSQRKEEVKLDKDYKSDGWIKKRDKIRKRDKYQCTKCGSKEKLVVHHDKYILGKKLWQVKDEWLRTMCEKCHKEYHDLLGKNAYEVIVLPKKKKIKKTKRKRRRKF